MSRLERFERDSDSGRELHLLELDRPESLPSELGLSSRFFICLVAWDSEDVAARAISTLAGRLLDAGGCCFCIWGKGCERVHDIIDETEIERARDCDDGSVVLTTWHDNEPILEALWFAMRTISPHDKYNHECSSLLVLAIGAGESLAQQIRSGLGAPDWLESTVLSEDDGPAM